MVAGDGCVVLQSSLSLPLPCSQTLPIERETVVVHHAFGTGAGPTHISKSTLHDCSLSARVHEVNGRLR